MAVVRQRVYCTFPKDQIREPILYNLGRVLPVVPNIRGASINDEIGLVFLELEGEEADVEKAITYLRERQVKVDQVEDDGAAFPSGLSP